jgi:hypothetical protein
VCGRAGIRVTYSRPADSSNVDGMFPERGSLDFAVLHPVCGLFSAPGLTPGSRFLALCSVFPCLMWAVSAVVVVHVLSTPSSLPGLPAK